MTGIPIKLRSLSRYAAFPVLVALGVGLLLSFSVLFFLQKNADSSGRTELTIALKKLQASLSIVTARNRMMGATVVLGLSEPVLKKAALGQFALDAPEVLARLNIVRKRFDAEGLYVIDKNGLMVANDTDGKKSTGKNVAFRPYYQQAIKGEETIYMAVGTNSDSRGAYFGAPLYEGDTDTSAIIGVVSTKMPVTQLDAALKEMDGESLLLSPQGVVFAATRPDWLLAMTPPFSQQRLDAIRKLKQFGMRFESKAPAMLAFNPSEEIITLDGNRYLAERIVLDWKDPAGQWTAVLMQNSDRWLSQAQKIKVTSGILLASLLLGIIAQLQLQKVRRLNLQLESEGTARAREQEEMLAAAEIRSQHAMIALKLRQVDDFSDLVSTFMRYANEKLDVLYGLFYVADDSERKLRVIGGYGVALENVGKEVLFGEGLAGQCAIEQKPIQLSQPPADYVWIASGTGAATPKFIWLRPLIMKDRLVGVLELATFREFGAEDQAFLADLELILAANVVMFGHREAIEAEYARQKASEDQLRAVLDSIQSVVFMLDRDGRYTLVNAYFEKASGIPKEQILGKTVFDLYSKELAETFAEQDRIVLESKEMTTFETPGREGTNRIFLTTKVPLKDGDGKIYGICGIATDITDQKRAESILRDQFTDQQTDAKLASTKLAISQSRKTK